MRNRLRLRLQHLYIIEAALIGLFFIQATRFLIGMMYARVGGASITISLDPSSVPPNAVDPTAVSAEITFLVYMLALPLLTLLLGRFRWFIIPAVVLTGAGRLLMLTGNVLTPTASAALVVGGSLVYIAMIIRHRAQTLPYFFIFGFGIDQIFRAVGNTLDPSWFANTKVVDIILGGKSLVIYYAQVQAVLTIAVIALSVLTVIGGRRAVRSQETTVSPDNALLPFWGGIGLGGLLFLELALLSTPNAIAGRAGVDYTIFAPLVTLATLLPLIPWVRKQARAFVGLFDGSVRGWSWMLVIALLLVFGTRFQGIPAGAALIAAQFAMSMMWWWLARPLAEKERGVTGLWLVMAILVFMLLAAGDNFTYEYAYVRGFAADFAFLNNIVLPFLRGFRGMGLGLLLLGVFLATLPMIQTQRRIPWTSGTGVQTFFGLLIAAGFSAGVALAVRPPLVAGVRGVDRIRIGSYNIHGGFSESYNYDLEAIARTIQQSGANVVLLQQVESGRMTSFGVNQPLWLARRLGMDTRFYPTNEGLQGLAVLSNVEIVYDDGNPLTSVGSQTGLQRVQIRPDAGVITLYNTWLGFLLETADGRTIEQQEQDQGRQLNELFAIIGTHYPDGNLGRMVIGGTFNNVPDSPLIDQMRKAGFSDPFAGLPLELSATLWRTGLPHVRFDYLWTRSMLPLGAVVMDTSASDHRMAVIEALITRQGQ
jgi:endonuclease/exonuclease/phosphatase family metal-dependent hydrolase